MLTKVLSDDLFKSIDLFFNEIKKNDLTEFYHMNNYTTTYDSKGIQIKYSIPGAEAQDLSVKIKNEVLYIEVKKSDLFNGLKDAIGIPLNVSIEGITSKYKNGLLVINMPYLTKKDDRDVIEIEVE